MVFLTYQVCLQRRLIYWMGLLVFTSLSIICLMTPIDSAQDFQALGALRHGSGSAQYTGHINDTKGRSMTLDDTIMRNANIYANDLSLDESMCFEEFPAIFAEIDRAMEYTNRSKGIQSEDLDISWKKSGLVRAMIFDKKVSILR